MSGAIAQETNTLGVYVRMYRALEALADKDRTYKGLLGDCFLIRLVRGDTQSTILIDCGLLLGSPNAADRIHAIVADIVTQAGGDLAGNRPGTLDLLVVTHPHWDHVSGFSQAQEVFFDPAKLKIANMWMSWIEAPEDKQAQAMRASFDKSSAAFAAIAARLQDNAAQFGADAAGRAMNGLEGFMGLAAAGRLSGRDAMEKLKTIAGAATQFLEPGTVLHTPGTNGLRAFVLGPPHDPKFLYKDDPSPGAAQETYLAAPTIDGDHMLRFAAGEDPDPSRDSPFAPPYCRILADGLETPPAAADPPEDPVRTWLRDVYYGIADAAKPAAAANARRRVDTDWLGALAPLAAKLDNHINNTSLALAFELPDGTVMLFPADAQVGNWLSWHEQDYTDENGRRLSADDLLGRTRFYKVGHHGSHNATLDARGLALMTRDDLVAMIPTDEELGKKQGSSGWQMPNPRVKAALQARTAGRILRNDRRYSPAARTADAELKDVPQPFFDRLTETDLFLEYRLL